MVRNIDGTFSFTDEERKMLSLKKIRFLENNPDKHNWREVNKKISKPCEILKGYLRNMNIDFAEEYQPLYPDRFFSIDIAFPDRKIGIEINGNQHYNSDGTLKKYYQDRHNLLELSDWKIYEFHFSLVYNNFIINSIKDILEKNPILHEFDYNFWIRDSLKKKIALIEKKNKSKIRKEKIKKDRINKIMNSNIDFSSFGWIQKVSNMMGWSHTHVKRWMKNNMREFYNEKCYIRRPYSSTE
jgi:hypothetical protein